MIKSIEHLCFDKDGVLIDVHTYWKHTIELRADYLKKKLNLTSYQSDFLIEVMGIDLSTGKIKNSGPVGVEPRQAIINIILDALDKISTTSNFSIINDLFLQVDDYQQKNKDYKINLLDGVIDFLEKAKPRYEMTIFTSDRKKNTELTLNTLGIDKYFSEIFGGDSVSKPKPNPEGINKICNRINVRKKNTSYITDTYNDLIMAEDAKLPFKVGVLTGLGLKNDLIKKADLVCKNLYEFMEYI